MDLPPELIVLHEPVRLRIVTLLYRQTDLGFSAIRESLGLTSGNLSSHAAKLADAGIIVSRDVLARTGFEKRFQITADGIARFERYLAVLEEFLGSTRAPAPSIAASAPPKTVSRSGTVMGVFLAGIFFMATEAAIQVFSDQTGSHYAGIGVTGLMMFVLAPLQQFLGGRLRRR